MADPLIDPEMLRAIMDMGPRPESEGGQRASGMARYAGTSGARQQARPEDQGYWWGGLSDRERAREGWRRSLKQSGEQFIDQELAQSLSEAMRTTPAALANTPPVFDEPSFTPFRRGGDPTPQDLRWMREYGGPGPRPTLWDIVGDAGTSREWEPDPAYDRPPTLGSDPIQGIRVGAGNWPQTGWRPSPHAWRNVRTEPMPGESLPPAIAPEPSTPSYVEEEIPYSQRAGPWGQSLQFEGMRRPTSTPQLPAPTVDPERAARVEQLMRELEEQQALEARLRALGR